MHSDPAPTAAPRPAPDSGARLQILRSLPLAPPRPTPPASPAAIRNPAAALAILPSVRRPPDGTADAGTGNHHSTSAPSAVPPGYKLPAAAREALAAAAQAPLAHNPAARRAAAHGPARSVRSANG